MEQQVGHEHYFNESYDTRERFVSYWHQINEITKLAPKSVLEIGVGNGFVSKYLKERGLNIVTLDIDKSLNPDIIGNVLDMPLEDNSFDVVACYEVLEHIIYKNFHKALSELYRVSKFYVILSLPDAGIVYRFGLKMSGLVEIKRCIPLPSFKKQVHKFDGQHYWEIGKAGYPLKKIITDIQRAGFKIEKTYRVFEIPYHRFFILNK
ncbi:MAG: methyltransferase type 11 [Candidatus Altiarchaeales archaeon WOR_SM1_79]|nr:MAG: methyltransferase type 11 [Candidatus Altiarchaeales archaeon WOR_SM1_79]